MLIVTSTTSLLLSLLLLVHLVPRSLLHLFHSDQIHRTFLFRKELLIQRVRPVTLPSSIHRVLYTCTS